MTKDPVVLARGPATPIRLLAKSDVKAWREQLSASGQAWLDATGFAGKGGECALLPGDGGQIMQAAYVLGQTPSLWDAADLAAKLPPGDWWAEDSPHLSRHDLILGWALAGYRFDRYKPFDKPAARLAVPGLPIDPTGALEIARAVSFGRDLVNTPACDMGPAELVHSIASMGESFGASVDVIEGDALLKANYPMIHAVGRASAQAPRLLDLRFGPEDAPKVTLVGKGVCFDTGGLDIKPANAMLLMKKDMGGAACMAALARALMSIGPRLRLRLLIPAVENSIAGNAFRPGDILTSRQGMTVEIGNTDAEGRLVLADALAEACSEKPDLLIDAATLTGAARVALGSELPALFSNDDATANALVEAGERVSDPLWRMPLFAPYRKLIEGRVADLSNTGSKPMAGSITAALFLEAFVESSIPWVHLDVFGWNDETRPGRPRGGEATAMRALLDFITRRFGVKH